MMQPGRRTFEQRALVTGAVLSLLVIGLAGCASGLAPKASGPATKAPYVGVFTGEFVDGMPLYRFPSIEVIGSRSAVHGPGGADGS